MTTLRVFVVGQSPRPDIEAEIARAAPGLSLRLEGALDGMTRAAIAALTPQQDADALFTVLPSGEAVTLSKAAVAARLGDRLAPGGPALLCCTGPFLGLPRRADLIEPSRVLDGLVGALLPAGTLGLFVPLAEQIETLSAARASPGVQVVALPLRPLSDAATINAAGHRMAEARPDLVILDCISYRAADKRRLAAILDCPILLSIAVAARAAACLLVE